jgi:ureidoglycolate lyase
LPIRVFERHPYTSQTFIPLGQAPSDANTAYLVIVAASKAGFGPEAGGPDFQRIESFIARGDQGITYDMGVWHAPMIVVGAKEISFVVTQWVNGEAEDECEEKGAAVGEVEVEVPIGLRGNGGLWRGKGKL